MRNLIRHQAAFYCVDELGITLNKQHFCDEIIFFVELWVGHGCVFVNDVTNVLHNYQTTNF